MSLHSLLVVTVDTQRLRALATEPSGAVHRYFQSLSAKVDASAKRKLSGQVLKVRTGNLRSSQAFRVEVEGGVLKAINENTATYARALHDGTRPHEIRARRAKMLTGWSYGGAPVFTPLVHHPGTRPRPWLLDAQKEVMAALR